MEKFSNGKIEEWSNRNMQEQMNGEMQKQYKGGIGKIEYRGMVVKRERDLKAPLVGLKWLLSPIMDQEGGLPLTSQTFSYRKEVLI